MTSVLLERTASADADLRVTAVSDLPRVEQDHDVPEAGSVVDERYEITGLLGEGGMGHVLSARHVVLGQRLAMKVLRREMTRDEEIVERFRREAKAASAIGHAGIVAVKDFGTLPSGASYFVMEHVEGKGLYDTLRESGPFSVARAVDVVRQMADALGAAHAAGIVHRDVKPENVILASFHGRPDHVKILDFGIAKLDFASRLSGAHRVLGTPAYMSPEQTRGESLDARTDVYSLGIVLYELLAGDPPFDHPLPLEVLRMQIQTPAPSVKLVRPDVPDALAELIARCLEKSPAARPPSMAALIAALSPFAGARAAGRSLSPAPAAAGEVPAAVSSEPARAAFAQAITLSQPGLVAAPPLESPASSRGASRATWLVGAGLFAIGVATLAAAGGILAGGRASSPRSPSGSAPAPSIVVEGTVTALAAPSVPSTPDAALEPGRVVEAVAPAAPAPAAPAPVASSPVSTTVPAHPHAHVPAHPVLEPPPSELTAPPPAAVAPPPAPAHPTIRVIDPWDAP